MKKLISILLTITLLTSCKKDIADKSVLQEEIVTARPTSKNCYTLSDVSKAPDLKLVTNAQEDTLYADGFIDTTSDFWRRYHVRTHPIRLVQNYLTRGNDAIRYGWDSGVLVNRVQLQCLVENIASFNSNCQNDWVYNESQGYLSPLNNYFFDGLFEFVTYEKGNGNNWKLLYTDFKKEFFPSSIPTVEYVLNTDFCYYFGTGERAIQAQMGDFYYNYFRFPNKDGVYRLVLKFNPSIKGCRAVKESNYNNNEVSIDLQISNGTVIILSTT